MVDPADVAEMRGLITQEQDAKARLERAKDEIDLWSKRGQLAERAGEQALADEAFEHFKRARADAAKAKHDLETLGMEKSMLRHQANLPEDDGALAQAEHLLEDFKAMNIRPKDEALRRVERETEAEDMLAALKSKMKEG